MGVCSRANEAVGSLSLTENERSHTSTVFQQLIDQNQQLKASLADSVRISAELRKSLEITSIECNQSRWQAFELKKRVEVLGLKDLRPDGARLEQSLLKSAGDLQVFESDNKRLQMALLRLSKAAQRFSISAVSNDADARLALEVEARKANEVLGFMAAQLSEVTALQATFQDGLVVSVKENLSIVIANFGTARGIKVGMPLRVTRAEKLIAEVRVVDARDKISGAMIQSFSSEHDRVRIGDRISIETTH